MLEVVAESPVTRRTPMPWLPQTSKQWNKRNAQLQLASLIIAIIIVVLTTVVIVSQK